LATTAANSTNARVTVPPNPAPLLDDEARNAGISDAAFAVCPEGGPQMTTTALAQTFPSPANDRTLPLRILLAEDNETMLRLLGFVLRSDGHALAEARDGTELLEALAASLLGEPAERFDAIVSEQSLPGIDGLTILAGLRARGLPTPFVLITADPAVRSRAQRLGGVVLDQPFNTQAIRDAVMAASEATTRTSRSPSTS
jgi:CheY-like chemotaxis protein